MSRKATRNLGWAGRRRGRLYDWSASRFPLYLELGTRVEAYHVSSHLDRGLWLDIGAGTGRLAKPLSEREGVEIVAMDPSFDMLSTGLLHSPRTGPANHITAVTGASDNALPFRDGIFDGAYCFGVLNRFHDWQRLVAPVHRALKPDARFVFNNRCLDAIRAAGNPRPATFGYLETARLLEELGALGLDILSARPCDLLSMGILIWHWAPNLPAERYAMATFAIRCWLDRALSRLDDLDDWVRLEAAMSKVLPLEASFQSVIVAVPAAQSGKRDADDCSEAGAWREPDDVGDRLRAVLRHSDTAPLVDNEPCLDLLCLIGPVLDHVTGETDFLSDALPKHRARIRATSEEIGRCMSPSLPLRIRHKSAKAHTALVNKTHGILSKLEGLRDGLTNRARR